MPISLSSIQIKLTSRLRVLDSAFERHLSTSRSKKHSDRFYIQEGLVSSLWQCWTRFCRDIVIGSASGAETRAGNNVTSNYCQYSEQEIIYAAKRFSLNQPVNRVKSIVANYNEPTWGDIVKLNLIIDGLSSTNKQVLASALSSSQTIIDLQLCRNASAHICADTLKAISVAAVRYESIVLSHPSHLMYWIDPFSKDFVWRSWLDEIKLISELAVQ